MSTIDQEKTGGAAAAGTMKSKVMALLNKALKIATDLKKALNGATKMKLAKSIWSAAQLKKVGMVIKNAALLKASKAPAKAKKAKKAASKSPKKAECVPPKIRTKDYPNCHVDKREKRGKKAPKKAAPKKKAKVAAKKKPAAKKAVAKKPAAKKLTVKELKARYAAYVKNKIWQKVKGKYVVVNPLLAKNYKKQIAKANRKKKPAAKKRTVKELKARYAAYVKNKIWQKVKGKYVVVNPLLAKNYKKQIAAANKKKKPAAK